MNIQTIYLDCTKEDHITFYQQPSCGNVEIVDIVVNSERRRGRGRALIESLLALLPTLSIRCLLVFAITRISNGVAHEFYEACGFRIVGRLHNFYRNADDEGRFEHALMYGRDI